jgi:hypothetical protein
MDDILMIVLLKVDREGEAWIVFFYAIYSPALSAKERIA